MSAEQHGDPWHNWPRVEVRADVLAPLVVNGMRRELQAALDAALGSGLKPLFDRIIETEQRCERLVARLAELERQAAEARPRRRGC